MLVNMTSLKDVEAFAKAKGLEGKAMHGCGKPPEAYGIRCIPHKVLIDKDGKVVKNFSLNLPEDLNPLVAE